MSSNGIDRDTGLARAMRERICSCLCADHRVESVVLFGSRAKGTWREGSDMDLVVFGRDLNRSDVWTWKDELEADVFPLGWSRPGGRCSPMHPWSLDIVIVDEYCDRHLREYIDRVGRPLCGGS